MDKSNMFFLWLKMHFTGVDSNYIMKNYTTEF